MLKHIFNSINNRKTLLGVGPMSKNCVDAVVETSIELNSPIMLIASRRQIECEKHGGGYVNNWTTESFSKYVNKIKKNSKVILCRDHGGPWQNYNEVNYRYNLKKTMNSAKDSFKADIDNNFKVLHIDTSIELNNKKVSFKKSIDRLFELYEYCYSYSKKNNKDILFEVGTEEQSGSTSTFEELEDTLNEIKKGCYKLKLPFPNFIVIQSGTKVMERRNIGSFESHIRVSRELPVEIQLIKNLEICKKYNIFMKEHNADYINNDSIKLHPLLGIHASNVAPEFGVTETLALLDVLEKEKLFKFKEEFIDIAFNSNKWEKWVINKKKLSKIEKAIICGHYVFTEQRVKDIKEELNFILKNKNINLDMYLRQTIKKSILRYMRGFGH
jgi:hypothetical protein